jgi:ubiquinone/menaquinone biosynthesis C-methylase UbiE
MSVYSRYVFPVLLDVMMRQPAFTAARMELLQKVRGEVLEIGFGTGLNLAYYPKDIGRVTTVDVNPGVHRLAAKRMQQSPIQVIHQIIDSKSLPMADASFDAVVSTWTLCSIADVESALREIRRVLKPDGRFYFVEHGLSPDPMVAKWQHRLTPVQKVIADGCHLDRDIKALVRAAGFRIDSVHEFLADGVPRIGSFMTLGVARP